MTGLQDQLDPVVQVPLYIRGTRDATSGQEAHAGLTVPLTTAEVITLQMCTTSSAYFINNKYLAAFHWQGYEDCAAPIRHDDGTNHRIRLTGVTSQVPPRGTSVLACD